MSVVVLPRTHNPSLIKRKTSDNPSGGTVRKTPALLKTADVVENKGEVGRHDDATKRGTPEQGEDGRPSAGEI